MHGLFKWSSKWWPGVVPLVIFWAIAAWTSTEPLEADLAQRSTAALKEAILDKRRGFGNKPCFIVNQPHARHGFHGSHRALPAVFGECVRRKGHVAARD